MRSSEPSVATAIVVRAEIAARGATPHLAIARSVVAAVDRELIVLQTMVATHVVWTTTLVVVHTHGVPLW
jgi:hypothetical protein